MDPDIPVLDQGPQPITGYFDIPRRAPPAWKTRRTDNEIAIDNWLRQLPNPTSPMALSPVESWSRHSSPSFQAPALIREPSPDQPKSTLAVQSPLSVLNMKNSKRETGQNEESKIVGCSQEPDPVRSTVTQPWPEALPNGKFRLEDRSNQSTLPVDESLERLATPFEAAGKKDQSESNTPLGTAAARLGTTQDYQARASPFTRLVKPPGKVANVHEQQCHPACSYQKREASLCAKSDCQTRFPKPEADASLRKRGWFERVSRSKVQHQYEVGQISQPHRNHQSTKPFQDTVLGLPACPVGILRRKDSYTNHHGNSQEGGKGSIAPDPKGSYHSLQHAAFPKKHDDCLKLCRVAQESHEDDPPCCPRPVVKEAYARSRARTPTTPLSRQ